MKITRHFTYEEMTLSNTALRIGLDNTPNEFQRASMGWLCSKILEPIRKNNGPVLITSGFRCRALNELIGGTNNSRHCFGEAADIVVPNMTIRELFEWIRLSKLPYDKVINEFDRWVHVQYNRTVNRRQAFIASHDEYGVKYQLV